jgi:phage tail-like protein
MDFPSASSQYYPPVGFHFEVRIIDAYSAVGTVAGALGLTANVDASFQEVSGISATINVEELYEGGENRYVHKLPKSINYSPLQLKRGLVSSLSAMGEWCKETFESGFEQKIVTKDVIVSLLDEENLPLMAWAFMGAFPTKWNVSNFNAQTNDIVVESMELTYRRFEQVNV